VLRLVDDFLTLKKAHGSSVEKAVYAEMTSAAFISRLIAKRAVTFYTHSDITMLRDGSSPSPSDWLKVGTEKEGSIKLKEYLSYDEMQISALVGIASPTPFINNGASLK